MPPGPALPILSRMKDSEDEHVGIGQFVADLIVSHEYLSYLAGTELRHLRPEARVSGNSLCARDQVPHDSCRGYRIHRVKELV